MDITYLEHMHNGKAWSIPVRRVEYAYEGMWAPVTVGPSPLATNMDDALGIGLATDPMPPVCLPSSDCVVIGGRAARIPARVLGPLGPGMAVRPSHWVIGRPSQMVGMVGIHCALWAPDFVASTAELRLRAPGMTMRLCPPGGLAAVDATVRSVTRWGRWQSGDPRPWRHGLDRSGEVAAPTEFAIAARAWLRGSAYVPAWLRDDGRGTRVPLLAVESFFGSSPAPATIGMWLDCLLPSCAFSPQPQPPWTNRLEGAARISQE